MQRLSKHQAGTGQSSVKGGGGGRAWAGWDIAMVYAKRGNMKVSGEGWGGGGDGCTPASNKGRKSLYYSAGQRTGGVWRVLCWGFACRCLQFQIEIGHVFRLLH